jgi:hypothetical protein
MKQRTGKQRTVKGAYSSDFKESKVTGLDGDAYYPGPTPNKYIKSDGKPSHHRVIDDEATGGFSGPVSRNR